MAPPEAVRVADGVGALGTILSVWAHPDDETYLAGGLMAAARDAGQRVVCVTATAGELGTTDPERWPPARLGAVRRWEAAAAMAVLGVREHHVLGLPDGGLAARRAKGLASVERLLADVRPDTVVTFGPDGATFHPDHVAVHEWVTAAWERTGSGARLLYATSTVEHLAAFGDAYERLGVYMGDERPVGTAADALAVHLRLHGAPLDRKLAALRAMATQTAAVVDAVGVDAYRAVIAEESFVDARAARVARPWPTPTSTADSRDGSSTSSTRSARSASAR